MRVGLIGFGAIGKGVARLLHPEDGVDLVGALVRDVSKSRGPGAPASFASLDELLAQQPEVVIELGGHEALRCHGPAILRAGSDLIFVSVGALADPDLEQAIVAAAQAGGGRACVPSGAIGGLDAIASAAVGGLHRVTHTTRKPPSSLLSSAEATSLREPRELFRGTAREGALRFPENINVAAAVGLAGIGLDRTEVCVVADPGVARNVHEVVAKGEFGELRFEIRNVPTDDNPRTGRLVAMSVVRALRRRHAPLVVA